MKVKVGAPLLIDPATAIAGPDFQPSPRRLSLRASPAKYTRYPITCRDGAQAWVVHVRFSRVARLHDDLEASCTQREAPLPPLPTRRIVDHLRRFDPNFLRQRQAELEAYLNEMMRHPHSSAAMRSFLQRGLAKEAVATTMTTTPAAATPAGHGGRWRHSVAFMLDDTATLRDELSEELSSSSAGAGAGAAVAPSPPETSPPRTPPRAAEAAARRRSALRAEQSGAAPPPLLPAATLPTAEMAPPPSAAPPPAPVALAQRAAPAAPARPAEALRPAMADSISIFLLALSLAVFAASAGREGKWVVSATATLLLAAALSAIVGGTASTPPVQHLFVPLNVFLLSVCLLVCTAAAGMSGFAIALTCGAALGFAVASSVYALAPPPPRRAVGAARASPPLRAGALPLSHAANTRAPPTRVPQPPLIAAAAAAADVKGTLAEKVAIAPPRLTFDAAVAYIRDCTALSNSQRLEAYALFKQAKDGDAPRSSPFRPVAAAKWRAWATKRGLPTVDAQAAYAALAVSAGAPLPLVPPLPVAVASAPAESAAPAAAAATAATISPASPPAASTLVVATPRRTLSELSLGATPTMAQMLPPLPRSLFAGLSAQQCAALRHANASLPRSLRYALDPVGTGWTYFKTAEDVAMYTQSFNERGHMYEGCLGVGVINAPMTDVLRAIYTLPRKNEYDAHWDGERDVERMQLGSPSWEEELASAVNARDPEESSTSPYVYGRSQMTQIYTKKVMIVSGRDCIVTTFGRRLSAPIPVVGGLASDVQGRWSAQRNATRPQRAQTPAMQTLLLGATSVDGLIDGIVGVKDSPNHARADAL